MLALILLGLLIVLPLLFILWTSVSKGSSIDLGAPLRNMLEHDLSQVLFNSIWLGLCVIAATTVLALPLAWMMAKTALRRHKCWISYY